MISRDQTLVNLYTIRAGLSLISRNKDEVIKFESIPHALRERVRIEKAMDGVFRGFEILSSYYAKKAPSGLDEESRRATAVLVGKELYQFDRHKQILNDAIWCIKDYKKHKKEFKDKKEYLDNCYTDIGVYTVFNYLIDESSTGFENGYGFSKKRLNTSQIRELQRKLALKGKVKFFEMCILQVSHINARILGTERYAIYTDYVMQYEKEKAEIRADGRQKYVESLIDQYGSLEKALQGVERYIENKTKEALAVYDAMYRCYNDFLPVTQWKNVDALIYYISDGYADTVKEALNLMLQQKQNDRIVNAIAKMEKNISTTVSRGMSMLESRISTGFASLSDQLDAVYRQQSLANTQLARANHAIDLSNVLSMKATMTSQQMADDISYFRSLIK